MCLRPRRPHQSKKIGEKNVSGGTPRIKKKRRKKCPRGVPTNQKKSAKKMSPRGPHQCGSAVEFSIKKLNRCYKIVAKIFEIELCTFGNRYKFLNWRRITFYLRWKRRKGRCGGMRREDRSGYFWGMFKRSFRFIYGLINLGEVSLHFLFCLIEFGAFISKHLSII